MEVKSFECFVTLQSSWCIYVSWVKSWEDFGLDPSLFAPNCKLWDVFHLLSSVFIKYLRNKINTLFVLLVDKVVEIVYSFLGLSVKYFCCVQPFFFAVYTLGHCFGVILVSPDCFQFEETLSQLDWYWRPESWRE